MDNTISINANSKEIIKDVFFNETCEAIKDPESRILGVSALSRVVGYEALNCELRINVKTIFNIFKHNSDGTFFTERVETESMHTYVNEGITPTVKVFLRANVTECSFNVFSSVKCKATVEICGWFVKEKVLNYLNSCASGVYCKSNLVKIENVVPLNENEVTLSFTDETRMPLAQILDYCGYVTIGSVYPSAGSYKLDGDINFRVTAIADNGQFLTQNFSHPFSTDCPNEFIYGDMHLDMEGIIKSLTFTITESDKRIIVSDIILKICGVGLEEKEIESVCDVYSVTNEISIESEKNDISTNFCLRSVREKATANNEVGSINEVLAVTNPMLSVSGTRSADGVTTEGVVQTTIIYTDGDEVKSHEAEIPFVSVIGAELSCESIFVPEVTVTAINARPKGGTEIEINVELLVVVRGVHTEEITVISGIEIGVEKEEDDFAICLYIAKPNETLWEVAKALNTDTDTLMSQNPDMELPLKGGEKIILYK